MIKSAKIPERILPLKNLLGVLFIAAGALHFVKTPLYVKVMPPYLPFANTLVLISGAVSVILGTFLVIERTRRLAAWGVIFYLIAVFPVNIHMALHPEIFPAIPVWVYWARLPLQFLLIAWAACYKQ